MWRLHGAVAREVACLGLAWLSAALGLGRGLLNSGIGRKVESWISSTNMIFILFFFSPSLLVFCTYIVSFISKSSLMDTALCHCSSLPEKSQAAALPALVSSREKEKPCPTSCSTNWNIVSGRVDIMRWKVLPLGLRFSRNISVISVWVYFAEEGKASISRLHPVPSRPVAASLLQ